MSLLAGLKFVKKPPPGAENVGGGGDDSPETVEGEKQKGEKERRHKDKKKDKRKDKKKKSAGHDDTEEPSSKRRKNQASAGGDSGMDWIDVALAVGDGKGGRSGEGEEPTAEEIAAKNREEEIDLEVVKGLRDPKTRRKYGLYDPLKGEQKDVPAGASGGTDGGTAGGLRGRVGGGGLPATFSAPKLTGVGDKGAGWRAKALKRAREKAEKSGQSLEEIVGDRWGSLDQLKRDSRGASAGGRRGRGGRYGYQQGRDELASLAAGEGRISADDTGGLLGKVGRDGSRGGRGGRLRIGRDANDTDVLKRFSSKLEDALGKNDETRRHRGGRRDDSKDRERGPRGGGDGGRGDRGDESRDRGRGPRGDDSRDRESGPRGDDREKGPRDGGEGGGRNEDRRSGEAERAVSGGERHRQEDGGGRREDAAAAAVADRVRSGGGRGTSRREDYDNHREEKQDASSRGRTRGEDTADSGGGGGGRSWRERQARDWNKGERALDGDRRETAADGDGSRLAGGRDDSRHRGDRSGRAGGEGGGGHRSVDAGGNRRADGAGAIGGRARCDDSRDRRPGGGSSRGERAPVRKAGTSRETDGQVGSSTTAAGKDDGFSSSGEGRGGGREEAGASSSSKAGRSRVGGAGVGGRPADVVREPAAAAAAGAVAETAVPSTRTPPGDRSKAIGLEKTAGVAEEGKAMATPTAKKLLTEAELTKLAVAAMKAKLKGDKASHARLTEEARAGREANAAAAAAASAAAAAAPWKPGQADDNSKDNAAADGTVGGTPRKTARKGGNNKKEDGSEGDDGEEELEVVTAFDENGRPIRTGGAALMREDLRTGARKGKLKKAGGRWAEHKDESVTDFVRREREEGFEDMDETFVRNVSRLGSRFKGTELGGAHTGLAGEDEEEDVDMRMFQRPEDRMTAVAAAERQKVKAIAQHRRQSAVTSRCPLCMDSSSFKKRLVLSLGEHTYLYLATGTHRLSEGHCYIVPIRHTPASTACDEEVWREIELFKSSLRKMAAADHDDDGANEAEDESGSEDRKKKHGSSSKKGKKKGKKKKKKSSSKGGHHDSDSDEGDSGGGGGGGGGGGVIFLETGGKPGSSAARHAFIEAVPVPRNASLDAPMYFRQALMDAGDEWSTHKKCIPSDPRRGGIRRAVPKGFPFFHVEWEDGGYANIIEGEEANFPRDFGVDTLAGILGIDPPSFGGRGRGRGVGRWGGGGGGAAVEEERKLVMAFLEKWKAFDWTSELDGGEYQESGAA